MSVEYTWCMLGDTRQTGQVRNQTAWLGMLQSLCQLLDSQVGQFFESHHTLLTKPTTLTTFTSRHVAALSGTTAKMVAAYLTCSAVPLSAKRVNSSSSRLLIMETSYWSTWCLIHSTRAALTGCWLGVYLRIAWYDIWLCFGQLTHTQQTCINQQFVCGRLRCVEEGLCENIDMRREHHRTADRDHIYQLFRCDSRGGWRFWFVFIHRITSLNCGGIF